LIGCTLRQKRNQLRNSRWITLLLFCFAVGVSTEVRCDDPDPQECGIECCYTIIVALSNEKIEGYSDFKNSTKASSGMQSLDDLAKICQRYGLHAKAVAIADVNELGRLCESYAVIVAVKPSHFVIAKSVGFKTVELIEPPAIKNVAIDDFVGNWLGVALLVSDKEINLENSANRQWVWQIAASVLLVVGFVGVVIWRSSIK
jgi:ABC-type bacteriocin/lantibiotic exporter with double-glycine peptidase domain